MIKQIYFGGFIMKNKKVLFGIITSMFVMLMIIGIVFFMHHPSTEEVVDNEIIEYTPQEEFSDDEIRKTIISLYFKNIETNSLIAEAKCIDVKDLYQNPYTYLINLLIAGPENNKLESALPEGTKVNACTLKGNTVYVDLSKEFIDNAPSGIDEESMVVYSIVNTLTELNEVSSVKFLINGEENLKFKDGKITFNNVFTKND